MKAIETHYKGYRFRSRLEARWAVFFDSLGRPWDYEAQGYDLPSGRYLPDFWLPIVRHQYENAGYFVEIKPVPPADLEKRLCAELFEATNHRVLLIAGEPRLGRFNVFKTEPVFPRNPLPDGSALPDDPCDRPRLVDMAGYDVSGWDEWCSVMASFLAYTWIGSVPYWSEPGIDQRRVHAALTAATSARFEHGESPRL